MTFNLDDKAAVYLEGVKNKSEYIRRLILSDFDVSNDLKTLVTQEERLKSDLEDIMQRLEMISKRIYMIKKDQYDEKQEIIRKHEMTMEYIQKMFKEKFVKVEKSKYLDELKKLRPSTNNDPVLFDFVMKIREEEKIDILGYDIYWYLVYNGIIEASDIMMKCLVK